MSTKIYNGLIYKGTNLVELNKLIQTSFNRCRKIAKTKYINSLTQYWVNIFDKKTINTNEQFHQLLGESRTSKNYDDNLLKALIDVINANRKQIITSGLRNPEFDFDLSVRLFPINNKKTLINCFHDDVEFQQELANYFDEYHYQNQSDKPDNIPTRQWNLRRKDWDKAYRNAGSSIVVHLFSQTTDIYSKYIDRKKLAELMLKSIPTLTERQFHLAKSNFYKDELLKLTSGLSDEEHRRQFWTLDQQVRTLMKGAKNIFLTKAKQYKLEEINLQTLLDYKFK